MTGPSLRIEGLRKSFDGRTVVSIDRLCVGGYGIEGLIGPNGAGKTTLMGLVTRRIDANEGRVLYDDGRGGGERNLAGMGMDAVARAGLVKTNQVVQDFAALTIRDSLRLALAGPSGERLWNVFAPRRADPGVEAEIEEHLARFAFSQPDGHALSAGEKKLLDILRCLVLRPRILLMDEPTAGLPDDVTRQVMDLVAERVCTDGMRVLVIEHDLDLIWEYCEHVHFLADGRLMAQGTPEEVRADATVAEKYMGAAVA